MEDYRFLLTRANKAFLDNRKAGIGVYKDTGKRDPEIELQRIEADKSGKSEKFRRIYRDFPIRSLSGQCAYVLRGFSGLQIFPDANHRSALYFLRILLWQRGIVVSASPTEAADLVRQLKDSTGPFYTGGMRQDRLLEKDQPYELIHSWFRNRLRLESPGQPFRFHVLKKDVSLDAWDWSQYHKIVDQPAAGSAPPRSPTSEASRE